jgi:hypothetical protein
MNFRSVRKSNDGYAWLTLALSFCGAIFCGFLLLTFLKETRQFEIIGSTLLTVLFGIVCAFSLKCILLPYEWELVIEGEWIRWGKTANPQRQRRLAVSQIKILIHDKSDNKVLANIGTWTLVPIGQGILMRAEDQAALVEYMRQTFPNLKIETA